MSATVDPRKRRELADAEAELFEYETRLSRGQYTHVEPLADDLGESPGPSARHFPETPPEPEINSIYAVYQGPSYEELVPSAAPHVTAVSFGPMTALSQVNDVENTRWLQSTVACSLEEWR